MHANEVLERAHSLGEEGDWSGAAELLREHLEELDDVPAMHCWLGVAERELGLEGIAYERFKRALALDPEDPYVLATAGNGIAAFDDPEAEQALRTASVIAPQVPIARMLYGAYLSREGLVDQALQELTAARELAPDDAQVAYELGVAHTLAGDAERAADVLADSVRLAPEDGWVRVVFGLVLLEADRPDEAAGELVSGARLEEDDFNAQIAAALAMAAIGHDGVAYEMLERGRLLAAEADVAMVTEVEERIDAGPDRARALLMDAVAPDLLRTRLRERP